jgi:nucleoside-diphosphate-sugar epimerase
MNAQLHVLFGAGQVGRPLAQLLLNAGKRVRVVKRSLGGVPPGVEVIQGDAADSGFCAQAAEGATTVYHCMNPPYDAKIWAKLVPRYMDNLINAAGRTGARLVVLDNVYMLGRPGNRPLDEDTPPNPCSRKGEVRARAAERLFEAHRRGDVLATAGRASDYYGPGGTLTHLGDAFWRPALMGKTARVLVNPDTIHTYHYIPDVSAGLLTLGCAESDVYGRPWMLPCAAPGTTRELVARFSSKLGREIKLTGVPRWIVKAMALFVPLIREVDEMLYQWDEPFVISDRRFRERFGQEPADVDEAAVATVAWARQHYATTSASASAAGKNAAANRDPHSAS